MLLAPKYTQIDLPVFGADTEVATSKPALERAAQLAWLYNPDNPTFVRAVRVECANLGRLGLNAFLRQSDSEFERVADAFQANIIPHRWGLFKPPQPVSRVRDPHKGFRIDTWNRRALRIPKDYILVAEVDALADAARKSCMDADHLPKHLKAAQDDYYAPGGNLLTDAKTLQLVNGIHVSDAQHQRWFVDIEPLWGTHPRLQNITCKSS